MVENYFRSLSSEQNYPRKHSPGVESLTGVLTEDDLEKFVREDDRARYIIKKDI
jgi:hypothetical protein